MNAEGFDTLALLLTDRRSRRGAFTAAFGTIVGLTALDESDAKRKKKKKKKKRCDLAGRECCTDADCPAGKRCCDGAVCGECCEVSHCDPDLYCTADYTCEDCSSRGEICSNSVECCSRNCDIPSGEAFGECGEHF